MKKLYFLFIREYKAKYITIFSLLFILLFGTFHTFSWFLYTKGILVSDNGKNIGDLVRITCETSSSYPREIKNTLKERHHEAYEWDSKKVDILTIGDSFSNGGGNGENRFYQDYIATIYDKKVLNIAPSTTELNYIEMVIALNNNGLLDMLKPKIIIIESVERFAVHRFSKDINFEYNITQEQFLQNMKHSIYNVDKAKIKHNISIINKRNYDCVLNPIYYKFTKKSIDKNKLVYKRELKRDMFLTKEANKLLFLKESIDFIQNSTNEKIKKLNNNINKLAKILKNKDISLIFMVVSDKYDLYSSYIKNNNLAKNNFFNIMESLKKEYYFIDTKSILLPLLEDRKNVYFPDDTHWSKIAAKEVVLNMPIKTIFNDKK